MAESSVCIAFLPDGPAALPLADIREILVQPDTFIWLDLVNPEPQVLDQLAQELALHELVVEDVQTAHQRPKLEAYPDSLFLALHAAKWQDERVQLGEMHLFCGPNFLAVIRHDARFSCAKALERLYRLDLTPSPGQALHALLDHIVDDYKPVLEALADLHATLEEEMLANGFSANRLSRLYALRRELLALHSAVDPLDEICRTLIREHPDVAAKNMKAYYRDVHDHVMRLTRGLDRLRQMLDDAMQLTTAAITLQQNASVQKLAGWGAILAIPTLVFSLYGMNFSFMPELHWRWGYPLALLGTGAACIFLYRRLRQRGWI